MKKSTKINKSATPDPPADTKNAGPDIPEDVFLFYLNSLGKDQDNHQTTHVGQDKKPPQARVRDRLKNNIFSGRFAPRFHALFPSSGDDTSLFTKELRQNLFEQHLKPKPKANIIKKNMPWLLYVACLVVYGFLSAEQNKKTGDLPIAIIAVSLLAELAYPWFIANSNRVISRIGKVLFVCAILMISYSPLTNIYNHFVTNIEKNSSDNAQIHELYKRKELFEKEIEESWAFINKQRNLMENLVPDSNPKARESYSDLIAAEQVSIREMEILVERAIERVSAIKQRQIDSETDWIELGLMFIARVIIVFATLGSVIFIRDNSVRLTGPMTSFRTTQASESG